MRPRSSVEGASPKVPERQKPSAPWIKDAELLSLFIHFSSGIIMSDMPPVYFKPHQPHNCRRAAFHNYRSPGTYMITISKHPAAPTFSRIIGDYRCQSRGDTAGTIAGSMATSRANPEFPDACHGPARTAFLLPGDFQPAPTPTSQCGSLV